MHRFIQNILRITFFFSLLFSSLGFTFSSPNHLNDEYTYPQCYQQLTLFEKNIQKVHIFDLLGNNLGELPLTFHDTETLCCIPYLITGEYILEITTKNSAELKSITVSP